MESKNFDESIGMTDFDYAMRWASRLDIAIPSIPRRSIDENPART
jgi:hypothetical protein